MYAQTVWWEEHIKIDLKALQGSIDLERIRTHQMLIGTSHTAFQGNIKGTLNTGWNNDVCDGISSGRI